MDDPKELHAQAERFRRLTRFAWDDETRRNLSELSQALESEAIALERRKSPEK